MPDPFYITTPIYYVNARPHLGHAYTTIVADVTVRYHAMENRDTFFLTGTDEHGDKVVRAAKKENLSPLVYVDRISNLFKGLWPELNICYDHFIRTTDSAHRVVVEQILKQIYDQGDIYFSEYEGKYCFGCERFYTDRELMDGKCPDHETETEIIKESNYFFRMSKYQNWLVDYITGHPDFIRPERYRNEVLSFLKEPLEDLCISRPKTRLQWGITLPFDAGYVTYVWFDALLNYISALGYPDGELYHKFWPHAQHIVAKDILKPHGIYWPIMLKAAGIPLFRHLNVHGYWNVDESKMSKSLGNVVEPLDLKNIYGLDAFRYFLLREMVFGLDAGFNEAALVQRINSDLANDLGNLFSRVLAMTHRYFNGVVPQSDGDVEGEFQLGLKTEALKTIEEFQSSMESFLFHKALTEVWEFINRLNKYIDVTAPWELAKKRATRNQLEAVIYNLLEGLRIISGLIYPVMPDTAATMHRHLGGDANAPFFSLERLKNWGGLKPGSTLPKSIILFPRIDANEVKTRLAKKEASRFNAPEGKAPISIETFNQIDLRVATVLHAEAVPKARKLMKLHVDMGEKRTIVAGIAQSYAPEDLVGRQIIVVANLRPTKIMGIVSEGMALTATDKSRQVLLTTERVVTPGTSLS